MHAFIVGQSFGTPDNARRDDLYFPYSDGLIISSKLKAFGYTHIQEELFESKDPKLTYSHFRSSFLHFLKSVNKGDKVVVYFSGHGYQNEKNENYLRCVRNKFGDSEDMPLDYLISELMKKESVNIILLDCCRYSPDHDLFEICSGVQTTTRSKDGTTSGVGHMKEISSVTLPGGQFVIGYGTLPGLKSYEQMGGVFTSCLVDKMEKGKDVHHTLLDTFSVMKEREIIVLDPSDPDRKKTMRVIQRGCQFSNAVGRVYFEKHQSESCSYVLIECGVCEKKTNMMFLKKSPNNKRLGYFRCVECKKISTSKL